MLLHEAKRYLDSFANYESKRPIGGLTTFNLKRVELLLEDLGSPHKKLKCIHVAGSNGKGSTCAFVASILQCSGYKVGLYTSPHLWNLTERIRILEPLSFSQSRAIISGQISEDELCLILEGIQPSIERVRRQHQFGELTLFEILTVLAFCYFYRQGVDFAILETGLGGRLDATNVTEAAICALTPISLEHTQLLGDTLAKIAMEKVAIIKSHHQHVVVAPQAFEVMRIIEAHCQNLNIQSLIVGKDIRYTCLAQGLEGQEFSIEGRQNKYSFLKTRLLGEHQLINGTVAVGIIELLLDEAPLVNQNTIADGIWKTVWPGRFEVVQKYPTIILDGAHNPAAIHELVKTVQEILPDKKIILVFGVSNDKDKKAMTIELSSLVQTVILTQANHPRAFDSHAQEFRDLFVGKNVICTQTVPEAIERALTMATADDVIVVTGSLFVVAEVRGYRP